MKKIFVPFFLIFNSSLLIISITFGWFCNVEFRKPSVTGYSLAAYFESGTGSSTDPYIISNGTHIYNLSWLQYHGYFDNTIPYFELKNDINMVVNSNIRVIPPIGTDNHPFNGVFNGKGYKISNLVVSTNKAVLYNKNSLPENYVFSDYVGFFGNTGSSSDIKNFILENPIVEVARNTDNSWEYENNLNNMSCGIAIGYVANKASSIGIIGGTLSNKRGIDYTTYNSILGSIGNSANIDMSTIDPNIEDPNAGNKGYFIPDNMYENWSSLSNLGSLTSTNAFHWLVPSSNSELGLGSFSVTTSRSGGDRITASNVSSFTFYRIPEVSTNSYAKTDYCYGFSNAGNPITVNLSDNNYNSSTGKYTVDGDGDNNPNLDEDIRDLNTVLMNVKNPLASKTNNPEQRMTNLNYYWKFNNSPDTGSGYKSSFTKNGITYTHAQNNFTIINESNEKLDQGLYNIFAASIKVNIVTASQDNPARIFLIASADNTTNRFIGLYKVSEYDSNSDSSYSSFKNGASNPLYEYISDTSGVTHFDKDMPLQALMLPKVKGEAVGCFFDVTEPGRYILSSTNSGVRFNYLSIVGVANGQDGEGGSSIYSYPTNIDFVTSTTTIVDNVFMDGENPLEHTKAIITYSDTILMNNVVLYFERSEALYVYVVPKDDSKKPLNSGTNATIYGNDSNNDKTDITITYENIIYS